MVKIQVNILKIIIWATEFKYIHLYYVRWLWSLDLINYYIMCFQISRLLSHPLLHLPGCGRCSGFDDGNRIGTIHKGGRNHCMEDLSSFSRYEYGKEYNILYCPPQGFGPDAKTRGGTLGVPGCIHIQGRRIFVEKVRNVFVMGEAFSISRN